MTMIVGLSGKKQAGKNTICSNIVSGFSCLNMVSGKTYENRIYSFADPLKRMCIELFGLTYNQCYGTDEQKDSLTEYLWDNLPHKIRYDNRVQVTRNSSLKTFHFEFNLPTGQMTAREFMQVLGTDIFRKQFDDKIWIKATFRQIAEDNPYLAMIADVRFPGEVDSILDKGGYVIRLTRNVCKLDNHSSETALDDYDFEDLKKCYILDNKDMSLEEQKEEALKIMNGVAKDGR